MFLVELTQWRGSLETWSLAGKFFFAANTSFPVVVLTEHLQASFSSMISPPVFSDRFAVTNFNWNLTGFPWPSNESIISRTSHNRIKVDFMGAIVRWRVGVIKDSIFPLLGDIKKAPVSRGSIFPIGYNEFTISLFKQCFHQTVSQISIILDIDFRDHFIRKFIQLFSCI